MPTQKTTRIMENIQFSNLYFLFNNLKLNHHQHYSSKNKAIKKSHEINKMCKINVVNMQLSDLN